MQLLPRNTAYVAKLRHDSTGLRRALRGGPSLDMLCYVVRARRIVLSAPI
jgi:hypothetical protein